LRQLGLADFGERVYVLREASLCRPEQIRLGSDVRVDDFCVLSAGEGGIAIGDFVHLAVYCSLIGAARIALDDFSGLSSRVSIYSSSDNYSGQSLSNPTIPDAFKRVTHADVLLGKHVIIGSGAVILPGSILEEGVALGALSLVNGRCRDFGIYAGQPARRLKERSRQLKRLEQELKKSRIAD
jgi:galactoside O-acetyltransferase